MKDLVVSVVMITYNHETFIEEAIHGVLAQLCDFTLELILANDQSTDQTDARIKFCFHNNKLPKHIDINYHHHLENKGMIGNFVWSLEQAQGKYIAICEGDDYWTDPLKLQKQVDFLEANSDYSLYAHNVQIVGQEFGQEINKPYYQDKKTAEISIKELISGFRLPTNSIMFRGDLKSVIFKEPWMSKVRSGDKCLYLTLAHHAKVYYEDKLMAAYRKHPGGVVGSYDSWDYNKHIAIHQNQIFFWRNFKEYFFPNYQEAIEINIANEFSKMALRAVDEAKYLHTVVYVFNTLKYDTQTYKLLQDKLVLIAKKRRKEFYKQQYLNFRILGSKVKQGLLGFLKFK